MYVVVELHVNGHELWFVVKEIYFGRNPHRIETSGKHTNELLWIRLPQNDMSLWWTNKSVPFEIVYYSLERMLCVFFLKSCQFTSSYIVCHFCAWHIKVSHHTLHAIFKLIFFLHINCHSAFKRNFSLII